VRIFLVIEKKKTYFKMLTKLLGLIFFYIFLAKPAQSDKNTGNWENVSLDKQEVKDALSFSISNVNDILKSETNYYKLFKLDRAQEQIVNGCIYKLNFTLILTKCVKNYKRLDKNPLDECSLADNQILLSCETFILNQAWLNPSMKAIRRPYCKYIY
jgi:hypothetical protein